MANIMGSGNPQPQISERTKAINRYNSSIANLLLVVIFSVINCVLLCFGGNVYFLFTASIPYIVVDLAMYFCGKYPAEAYADIAAPEFFNNGVFVFLLSMAFLIILLYLICWLFARKGNVGWLIAALVLFAVDTAAMFFWYNVSISMVLDYVFHGWVLVSLILGITSYFKLKKLPPEPPVPAAPAEGDSAEENNDDQVQH